MAHRFSNFAEAYAYLDSRWGIAAAMQDTAYGFCDDADDAADVENWHWAVHYCVYAIKSAMSAFDILFENYSFSFDQAATPECHYWASQAGGDGEVTMSAILDAMWNAQPHQSLLFIPMIDAMRGSIWNKTVTEEWMSNALKHFE